MTLIQRKHHLSEIKDMVTFPSLKTCSSFILANFFELALIGWCLVFIFSLMDLASDAKHWLFWGGCLCSLPLLLYFVVYLLRSVENFFIRAIWVYRFRKRIKVDALAKKCISSPSRYVLYVKNYGGFDQLRMSPVAVLEDKQEISFSVVYPFSKKAIDICRQTGVKVFKR